MFLKTVVQGSAHLANIGASAFIHSSLRVVCWYWVLGVHKLLLQGPEGTEGDLMANGAKNLKMDSERVIDPLVSRSCVVCRSGCVPVSLEGLRHKVLLLLSMTHS